MSTPKVHYTEGLTHPYKSQRALCGQIRPKRITQRIRRIDCKNCKKAIVKILTKEY